MRYQALCIRTSKVDFQSLSCIHYACIALIIPRSNEPVIVFQFWTGKIQQHVLFLCDGLLALVDVSNLVNLNTSF